MRSILNALSVIEKVALLQPVSLSEIARETKLPKTTAHRYLQTLREAGWLSLQSEDPPRWQLTGHAVAVIQQGLPATSLRDAAIPVMERVRDETGETVFLTVPDGMECMLVERVDGTQPVRTFNPVGVRMRLNGPSTGKVLLAYMEPAEIERVIGHGLEAYTENTIVQAEELYRELASIRERRFAVNVGEWRPDVAGVGAAILNSQGRGVAAISVSIPYFRFNTAAVPMLGEMVANAASEIGERLRSSNL
jgi:IclR family acetate operon transcriptional repressor